MLRITCIILLFLTVGATLSFGQRDHRHKLAWSADRPLTWDDFKTRSNNAGGMKAMTDSGIAIWFDCANEEDPVVVKCFFDKSKSWTKDPENKVLLEHEQLHFDITELFTRKLRKQLSELMDPCGKDSGKIQTLYDRNFEEMNKYQQRYDKETEHSVKELVQKGWQEKVKRELAQLLDYSS